MSQAIVAGVTIRARIVGPVTVQAPLDMGASTAIVIAIVVAIVIVIIIVVAIV